jgi:K+-transporting ATPase KdpF subunit
MSAGDLVALAVSIGVLAYLLFVLLRPERF